MPPEEDDEPEMKIWRDRRDQRNDIANRDQEQRDRVQKDEQRREERNKRDD